MGEEGDDAAGVAGGAAVVVAFLPEAADVVCYVAGEALVWEASEGVGLAGGLGGSWGVNLTIMWRWFPDQTPAWGQFGVLFSKIGTRRSEQRGREERDEPVAE